MFLQGIQELMNKNPEPEQTLTKMPSLVVDKSLITVAKYQSFTRTASVVSVTPAAISRQIRVLEDYLGTKLFICSGGTVRLSPEGSAIYYAVQLSTSHNQRRGTESLSELVGRWDKYLHAFENPVQPQPLNQKQLLLSSNVKSQFQPPSLEAKHQIRHRSNRPS
ncbi:LysR family transcriptional regulator [Rhodoferax sp. GW822-FHT02A01]|uniref:helix-turn-helix domain-containing protein n=1 Tax=Rhodoferax sp. GW822-FHT02A01 TaxID=3141537 RepID=UPI00315DB51B